MIGSFGAKIVALGARFWGSGAKIGGSGAKIWGTVAKSEAYGVKIGPPRPGIGALGPILGHLLLDWWLWGQD